MTKKETIEITQYESYKIWLGLLLGIVGMVLYIINYPTFFYGLPILNPSFVIGWGLFILGFFLIMIAFSDRKTYKVEVSSK